MLQIFGGLSLAVISVGSMLAQIVLVQKLLLHRGRWKWGKDSVCHAILAQVSRTAALWTASEGRFPRQRGHAHRPERRHLVGIQVGETLHNDFFRSPIQEP